MFTHKPAAAVHPQEIVSVLDSGLNDIFHEFFRVPGKIFLGVPYALQTPVHEDIFVTKLPSHLFLRTDTTLFAP